VIQITVSLAIIRHSTFPPVKAITINFGFLVKAITPCKSENPATVSGIEEKP